MWLYFLFYFFKRFFSCALVTQPMYDFDRLCPKFTSALSLPLHHLSSFTKFICFLSYLCVWSHPESIHLRLLRVLHHSPRVCVANHDDLPICSFVPASRTPLSSTVQAWGMLSLQAFLNFYLILVPPCYIVNQLVQIPFTTSFNFLALSQIRSLIP